MQRKTQTKSSTKVEALGLLLISASQSRAALLREMLESRSLRGEIHRIGPGPGAVDCALGRDKRRSGQPPNIILLDFAEPDPASMAVAKQLGLNSASLQAPLILLTSAESERILSTGDLPFDASRIFAPTSLESFADNMRQHPRNRFLHALTVLSDLGPILVRLPLARPSSDRREFALTA